MLSLIAVMGHQVVLLQTLSLIPIFLDRPQHVIATYCCKMLQMFTPKPNCWLGLVSSAWSEVLTWLMESCQCCNFPSAQTAVRLFSDSLVNSLPDGTTVLVVVQWTGARLSADTNNSLAFRENISCYINLAHIAFKARSVLKDNDQVDPQEKWTQNNRFHHSQMSTNPNVDILIVSSKPDSR